MPQRIPVKVTPRSSRNEMSLQADGSYKIKLTAAPVDGAANEALIRFLSKELDVPKSAVRIVRGERSKNKIIEIGAVQQRSDK